MAAPTPAAAVSARTDAAPSGPAPATTAELMRRHTLNCVASGGRCKPGEPCHE